MLDRVTLVSRLHAALEANPSFRAAWIGGGAAFGRVDRYSDVDLCVLCDPAHSDDAFAAVEAAIVPISLRYHIPEPAWHGMRQRFYRLQDADHHLFVDFCVMPPDRLAQFMEPVRHGRPIVLFDRAGELVPAEPAAELQARLDRRLESAVQRFQFFSRTMVERAVGRGKFVEAVGAWHGMVLLPLVEVLRARHSPLRQDYGLRYSDLDLPPRVYAQLEHLTSITSLPDLIDKLPRAEALFEQTLSELPGR